MVDKRRVAASFSSAANRYNRYAELQKSVADELSRLVEKYIPINDNILDIGCGTGFMAQNLGGKYNMLQLDISPAMCLQASEYGKVICADFDNIYVKYQNVISSMALQWSDDITGLIDKIIAKLPVGGHFIFSLITNKSLQNIDYVNNLPQPIEHLNIVEQYSVDYVLDFTSQIELIRYMRNIGANASDKKILKHNALKQPISTIWNIQYICIKL